MNEKLIIEFLKEIGRDIDNLHQLNTNLDPKIEKAIDDIKTKINEKIYNLFLDK